MGDRKRRWNIELSGFAINRLYFKVETPTPTNSTDAQVIGDYYRRWTNDCSSRLLDLVRAGLSCHLLIDKVARLESVCFLNE